MIAAGGIYTGEDIYRMMELGASGVQLGTRFVTTDECDASTAFKEQYIKARQEDIEIIKSPVGMPEEQLAVRSFSRLKRESNNPNHVLSTALKHVIYPKVLIASCLRFTMHLKETSTMDTHLPALMPTVQAA